MAHRGTPPGVPLCAWNKCLPCDILAEVHENLSHLRTRGGTGGIEVAVVALEQAGANSPLHGGQSPVRGRGSVVEY